MTSTTGVEALRRRDEGGRLRVYLDQSTLSRLVDDPARQSLRDLLKAGVESEAIVCPLSREHHAESILARRSYEDMDALSEDLCMGIDFYDDDYITWAEIGAAARDFLGHEPAGPMWDEAFKTDPDTPRDDLFPGGFRVIARLPHTDELVRAEVEHEKNAKLAVGVYEQARDDGVTFEEQAGRELAASVMRELAPLAAPELHRQRIAREYQRFAEAAPGLDPMAPGHPVHRVMALGLRGTRVERLPARFPELSDRGIEFAQSPELTHMPMIRYPPLFHAGLAVTPGRKAKPGDRFDISHLTKALSRCDLVTADSGMTQLCRDFKLIPNGVELFSTRELDAFEDRLRQLV